MAIIIDPDEPKYERPVASTDVTRIASYPIYPSSNPGTPYVPQTEAEALDPSTPDWDTAWHANPEATSPYEALSDDSKAAYAAFEDIVRKNQIVAFEKRSHKKHAYANKTYSGVDMVVSISLPGQGSYEFDDLQTMSVSTHRENFPVRLLGMVNAAGFTSGPRTIAGSLIFTMIEANPFYRVARELYEHSAKSLWDRTSATEYPLADSLPPFDITITFDNEYELDGAAMRIFGVKIIDEGQTLSIDDMVTEVTYSYMAAGIAPVHLAKNWKIDNESYKKHWGI